MPVSYGSYVGSDYRTNPFIAHFINCKLYMERTGYKELDFRTRMEQITNIREQTMEFPHD